MRLSLNALPECILRGVMPPLSAAVARRASLSGSQPRVSMLVMPLAHVRVCGASGRGCCAWLLCSAGPCMHEYVSDAGAR